MSEYEKKLNLLNVKELRAFIKGYNLQMKIVMTKKKKEELISEILKHSDYKNGQVIIKSHPIEGNIEPKEKVVKPKKETVVKPKKEKVVKPKKEKVVEPKKETVVEPKIVVEPKKETVIKVESNKNKKSFLEWMEPNENKESDDMYSQKQKEILDKIGNELNKKIDVAKVENYLDSNIPDKGEIITDLFNWLEDKESKNILVDYVTFIKKVVYSMYLKKRLSKLNLFDGIVLSNMIINDNLLKRYINNFTKYSIIRTFINMEPMIPKNQLGKEISNLMLEYVTIK